MDSQLGRSTARLIDWKHPTLGCWPVDRAVDRWLWPVDRGHNGHKYDRCAGRPEGHFWPFQTAKGQIFERIYICLLLSWFDQDFLRENFLSFKCYQQEFKRVFVVKRSIFYLFSRVGIFQRKESLLGISFDLNFNIYLEIFPIIFLCSKQLVFSHLSYHLYPIYMIVFLVRI